MTKCCWTKELNTHTKDSFFRFCSSSLPVSISLCTFPCPLCFGSEIEMSLLCSELLASDTHSHSLFSPFRECLVFPFFPALGFFFLLILHLLNSLSSLKNMTREGNPNRPPSTAHLRDKRRMGTHYHNPGPHEES